MQLSLKVKGLSFAHDATDNSKKDIRWQTYSLYDTKHRNRRTSSITIISYEN
jgi:hypothetical protein